MRMWKLMDEQQGDAPTGGGDAKEPSLLEAMGKGEAPPETPPAEPAAPTPEQQALFNAEKDGRRPEHVPAKFWNAEKGEVNVEAWAKSTKELETRMRDVGLPPKSADEYKFDPPKELAEAGLDLDNAQAKAFRDKALAAGLTQKQFEFVMGEYYGGLSSMVGHAQNVGREQAQAAMLAHYKTPEATQAAVKDAFRAFSAYATDDEMQQIDQIGNNPIVLRILAKVGRDLKEDPGITTHAMPSAEDIDTLMAKGSPYWDATHPQHKATLAKVTAYHEAKAREAQRRRA